VHRALEYFEAGSTHSDWYRTSGVIGSNRTMIHLGAGVGYQSRGGFVVTLVSQNSIKKSPRSEQAFRNFCSKIGARCVFKPKISNLRDVVDTRHSLYATSQHVGSNELFSCYRVLENHSDLVVPRDRVVDDDANEQHWNNLVIMLTKACVPYRTIEVFRTGAPRDQADIDWLIRCGR
jgi:hypothetical protein